MKNKIRTLLIIMALVFLLPTGAACQGMPVYDNTSFISLVKQLVESAKQTGEMIKTVQFLKDAKETIEKVNNAVRQYQAVREIHENNQALVNMVRNDLRGILNSPYIHPDEIDTVSDAFTTIIDGSLQNLEFMDQVLSSGFLKLNDAERLKILKSHRTQSRTMIANVTLKNKRYEMIISFREMKDKVNNRETNY